MRRFRFGLAVIPAKIYVREAWRAHEKNDHKPPRDISPLQVRRFEADKICCYHPHDDMMNVVGFRSGKLRPGMHMPKAFARTWLRVTEVRVQRVQDISDEDIEAEGFGGDWPSNVFPDLGMNGDMSMPECFARLWDSIYAAPKPRYSRVDGKRAITSYESFPWAGKSRTETHRGKPHIITANPWVAVTVFEKTERPGNG